MSIEARCKVVMLGVSGVGKTSLILQWMLNRFPEIHDPTVEDSYRKQITIHGQTCLVEIVDTAGQEQYATLRDQSIRCGEGFILVYSISSRPSFEGIRQFYDLIAKVKGYSSPVAIFLVGNKSDIPEREVSTQDGKALAKELECAFVETSAKNSSGMEKAFHDVVRELRRQQQQGAGNRDVELRNHGSRPEKGESGAENLVWKEVWREVWKVCSSLLQCSCAR